MTADETSGTPTAEDETRRKFLEALQAKGSRQGEAHLDGGSRGGSPHGKVDAKRVFRRKSG